MTAVDHGSAPEPIATPIGLDLYWIPLGAGAHVVRISGGAYELIAALAHRRPRCDLYHSALVATTADGSYVIEMAPISDEHGRRDRGAVSEGPVGMRWIGRWRVFRYEVRRWRGGVIPDIGSAVDSPVRVTDNAAETGRVLDLVSSVPTPTWGRDELHGGDMWNSNSVTAWLLACAGLESAAGDPPPGGRAPGWGAGVAVARRSAERSLTYRERRALSTARR